MHAISHKLTVGLLTVLFASLQLLGQWLHALGHDHAHLHLPGHSHASNEHSHHGCCHHHHASCADEEATAESGSEETTPGYRRDSSGFHGFCAVCDYRASTFQNSQTSAAPTLPEPVELAPFADSSRVEREYDRLTQPRAPPSAILPA